jgi:hypothetical protein
MESAMRPSRLLALLLAACALSPVQAGTVQKCVGPGGHVVYRDAPCERGQRVLESWAFRPDPPIPGAAGAMRPGTQSPTRRARASARRPIRAVAQRDPCHAARERRDAVERRVGLARTYELLSALQRDVYEACK